MNPLKLDSDSRAKLDRRTKIGESCIREAGWDGVTNRDGWLTDRETFAKDAVADILTALLGPAGTSVAQVSALEAGSVRESARYFLEAALKSWEGDAEDYIEA